MNSSETTPALALVEAPERVASPPPSRWSRLTWGALKWVVGSLLSTFLVLSVVVVAASVATIVQVVRIGDSGARATWGDVAAHQPQNDD